MVQTYPIAETVTTLIEAESKFGLTPSNEPEFFWEWSVDLPKLTESEQIRLDLIKQRYQYHRKYGQLAESTVNAIIVSPLLELAGFFDPPFRLRSEVSVKFEVEDKDEILRGRIDSLVVLDRLWVLLVESKQTSFNMDVALPQALAYMMTNPDPERPTYGLVSNGAYFMFLKLILGARSHYALSSDFSLYRQRNELWDVLKILKQIGQKSSPSPINNSELPLKIMLPQNLRNASDNLLAPPAPTVQSETPPHNPPVHCTPTANPIAAIPPESPPEKYSH